MSKKSMVWIGIILLLVARFTVSREPIPEGDVTVFWEFACGVELQAFQGYFEFTKDTGIFPKKDGWYIYYYREHHGRHVFKLKSEQVKQSIPELFNTIDREVVEPKQRFTRHDDIAAKNLRRANCQSIRDEVHQDPELFLDKLNSEALESSRQSQLKSFDRQWQRSQLFGSRCYLKYCSYLCGFYSALKLVFLVNGMQNLARGWPIHH